MKEGIDNLILKHEDSDPAKYTLKCSVSDFKKLQKLLSKTYKIRDDWGAKGLWKHNGTTKKPTRTGIVKFKNFEIEVTCPSNYTGEFIIKEVKE
jgi:hypothetical protein